MPVIKNIFIFGDSITYGQWDLSNGWANRVRSHYDDQVLPVPDEYIITYNLGIPSDTSHGLAHRIQQETRSRLTPNPAVKEIQFIVAIGANDARWLVEDQRRGTDLVNFKSNMEKISSAALKFSNNITYLGLLPCVEETVRKSAEKHQWVESYDNRALQQYDQAIKTHCMNLGHSFVDIYPVFSQYDCNSLLCDGLHPNSDGHALIFDLIMRELNSATAPT